MSLLATPPRLLRIPLVALLALASQASAQITITRADIIAQLTTTGSGTSFDLVGESDFPAVQALADRSGGGQTWDFSSFSWTEEASSTSAPASGAVPGSEIAALQAASHVVVYTEADSVAYGFYRVTDDAFEILGVTTEVDDEQGGTVTGGILFTPFDLVMPLPLTASSAWTSTYALELIPAIPEFETETTETSSVEGWGTLLTPAGSAAVLKVRTKAVTTSTITIPNLPPIVTTDSSYTVEFVSKDGTSAAIFLDSDGEVWDASYSVLSGSGTAGEPTAGGHDALGISLKTENPVRRGTLVELAYSLPEAADVRLEAFDMLGRRVATLAEGPRGAGAQRATFATDGLRAGVYVVRLGAGAQSASLRVTVAG